MSLRNRDDTGRLYGYADVGRMGLGHGLLAWARCVVWADRQGVPVIAPRWLRLRIGPYLRSERDKRFYARLFRVSRKQVGGMHRLFLLSTAHQLTAETEMPPSDYKPFRNTVVVFTNLITGNERTFFHEIVGCNKLVREALIDMTRPRFLPSPLDQPHVAIHVRGGDFQNPRDISVLKSGRHNQRLPITWYVDMLTGLRHRLGHDLPAILYSDCPDDELEPLLVLRDVRRSRYREAITDMLAMSQASVMISSGSGFSRWASYLGQVPRLCFPGQRVIRTLGPLSNGPELEPECGVATEIPEGFMLYARQRVKHSTNA